MARAFLSLGSNLGDRQAHLRDAVRLLQERGVEVVRASSVYDTEPVGLAEQPPFLNAVIEVLTELGPPELLSAAQAVEDALGRRREVRWGPRTVDIDILLNDDCRIDLPDLQVPHPRMHERRFVLLPLLELRPDIAIPGRGAAKECLDALGADEQPARRLGPFPLP